jgi:hypothetical protein
MLGMRGLNAVAAQRGFSAGTLLIAAGGLALYQMTSLVLGPAGSRELHLSLAIPAVDAEEVSDAVRPSGTHVLGAVVAVAPLPSPTASSAVLRQPAQARVAATPAPAPVVATPPAPVPVVATEPARPVPSEPAGRHGRGRPQPPKHHDAD